ncbi:hypothetical protein DXG03_006354 [Asterophora parasitica]|uniref:Uncharacterized protein n=1 Tax=Asterophora parasitica TaxID=117018 RepID=A0A9P7G1A6_9AGAR|nr:hypothetical protein DXG03_006354 [Asterophora parasitica]
MDEDDRHRDRGKKKVQESNNAPTRRRNKKLPNSMQTMDNNPDRQFILWGNRYFPGTAATATEAAIGQQLLLTDISGPVFPASPHTPSNTPSSSPAGSTLAPPSTQGTPSPVVSVRSYSTGSVSSSNVATPSSTSQSPDKGTEYLPEPDVYPSGQPEPTVESPLQASNPLETYPPSTPYHDSTNPPWNQPESPADLHDNVTHHSPMPVTGYYQNTLSAFPVGPVDQQMLNAPGAFDPNTMPLFNPESSLPSAPLLFQQVAYNQRVLDQSSAMVPVLDIGHMPHHHLYAEELHPGLTESLLFAQSGDHALSDSYSQRSLSFDQASDNSLSVFDSSEHSVSPNAPNISQAFPSSTSISQLPMEFLVEQLGTTVNLQQFSEFGAEYEFMQAQHGYTALMPSDYSQPPTAEQPLPSGHSTRSPTARPPCLLRDTGSRQSYEQSVPFSASLLETELSMRPVGNAQYEAHSGVESNPTSMALTVASQTSRSQLNPGHTQFPETTTRRFRRSSSSRLPEMMRRRRATESAVIQRRILSSSASESHTIHSRNRSDGYRSTLVPDAVGPARYSIDTTNLSPGSVMFPIDWMSDRHLQADEPDYFFNHVLPDDNNVLASASTQGPTPYENQFNSQPDYIGGY